MVEPTERFSSRVENYVKFRPGYPTGVIDLLASACGLSRQSIVADIGSGTGILTNLFLKNGNKVFGVEPNREMRMAAEHFLRDYPRFISVDARAEATSLNDHSIDILTAGQAFHWFDREKSRQEFIRILKPGGWVVLIWNERRLDSSSFLRAVEDLLLKFGTLYDQVRHENAYDYVAPFFGGGRFEQASFKNLQRLDLDAFKGRIFSASYTPEPGHPNFEPMLEQLLVIFSAHQVNGKVTIEYDTKVFYGQMNQATTTTPNP